MQAIKDVVDDVGFFTCRVLVIGAVCVVLVVRVVLLALSPFYFWRE